MKRWFVLPVAILAASCAPPTPGHGSGHSGPSEPHHSAPQGTPSASPAPTGYALAPVHDPGHVTGTLQGPCHTRDNGQLPDPACTPGSIDPAVTAAVLCAPGYTTRAYRAAESETEAFKWHVAEPAYGQDNVSGELDHLVSLELGGSNDASNLWVEAGPIPNPKDTVENALHAWVCAASGTDAQDRLHAAQIAISTDWMTAEQALGIGG